MDYSQKLSSGKQLLVTIDVGNSRIKVGLFRQNSDAAFGKKLPKYIRSMAVDVENALPWDELAQWTLDYPESVSAVILGGVNPRGRDKILDGWPNTNWPDPVVLDNPFVLPIKINADSPRTVGVDRLLNAVAGNIIRPRGKPMIIVDSGTATTVDVVSAEGAFEGGAILPGFQLCARSLHEYTALLPHISNEEMAQNMPEPLGKDTRKAIRSGLFWGQLGAVRELLSHLKTVLADEPLVIVTGGAGRLLMPHMEKEVLHLPYLALQGLVVAGQQLRDVEANS